ncbi:MAG: hypothetical protein JRI43_01420 [Deltaproteobacteria bacterium]|nr:hypothetical protein [Deltaproteobacteria bacterium]MBW1911830.1 hypothetical protein [Deltaproteobacteria bacterium]
MPHYYPHGNLFVPDEVPLLKDPSFEEINSPTVTHKNTHKWLFEDIPDVTDIEQQGLGDCAMIATFMAIVNFDEGKEYIQTMMKDTGDGTVTVRLYDKDFINIGTIPDND